MTTKIQTEEAETATVDGYIDAGVVSRNFAQKNADSLARLRKPGRSTDERLYVDKDDRGVIDSIIGDYGAGFGGEAAEVFHPLSDEAEKVFRAAYKITKS